MEKQVYFDNNPECNLDNRWAQRTIAQELEACDMETPPRELFLSYLPRNAKILDAGCGSGKWVIYLKRRGYDIVGIDNNGPAVARLKAYDQSLQVELGNILNVQYPDNSFDAYISMGVIEHFEDGPISALEEAYRLLKPGGLIFVSVPAVSLIRKVIRPRVRNAINAFPRVFTLLTSAGSGSKRDALFGGLANIVPGKMRPILVGNRASYCHFVEYRYSKYELQSFLKRCNFEILKTVPHDLYGSKDHAIGLVFDFPFLGARDGVDCRLNATGKLISRTLDRLSPWIACSSVLCVGRSLKRG